MLVHFGETKSGNSLENWRNHIRKVAYWLLILVPLALAVNVAPHIYTGQLEGRIDRVEAESCSAKRLRPGCWTVHLTDRAGKHTSFGLHRDISAPVAHSLRRGDPVKITYVYEPVHFMFEMRWPLEIRSGGRVLYDQALSRHDMAVTVNRFNMPVGVFLLLAPIVLLFLYAKR